MKNKIKRRLLVSIVLIFSIYFLTVHILISTKAKEIPPNDADYLVILGARLHGERMSLSLQYRVEAALQYLEENKETRVVVSGGQGPGEDITEAEAMSRYLQRNGISKERIVVEDQSTTTHENLLFSKKLVNDDDHVVIVSNDFHLFRASMIAKRVGFEDVYTLPAKTPTIVVLKLWIREYLAVFKTWMFDR
jgi:uncharacterized SAM-binding protein YcdF (DUF218 family)